MDDITFEKLLSPNSDRVIFRGIWGSHAYAKNSHSQIWLFYILAELCPGILVASARFCDNESL